MLETEVKTTDRKESKSIVRDKMAADLLFLLESYNNKDIGLRIISEKTNISEKTLKRVKEAASDPHVNTVKRFYNYFFNILPEKRDEDQELKLALRSLIDTFEIGNHKKDEFDLAGLLENDSVFRKLYLYSRSGPITLEWIKEEFGKYGIDMVQKMLLKDVLIESDKGDYSQGPVSVSRNHNAIRASLKDFIFEHITDEQLDVMNEASLFYVIEGVTREMKLEMGRLTQEYRNKLANLLVEGKDKGDERVFVFGGVGSLAPIPTKFLRRIQ